MIFAMIAIFAAGLFAGAALYINLVEHPARVECGTEIALAEFAPSYRRATLLQASLAALGLISGVAAWLSLGRLPLLVGGLLLGAVIPFTLIAILPTNKRLLDPSLERTSIRATMLLAQWQRLHAARTILSLAAFGLLVWCMASANSASNSLTAGEADADSSTISPQQHGTRSFSWIR
jgi:uncharacterized membrane protein